MSFTIFQDCLSPHQLPLAKRISNLLKNRGFLYVYKDDDLCSRQKMGWGDGIDSRLAKEHYAPKLDRLLQTSDILLTMYRDVELFKKRHSLGLKSFLQTERWFKPKIGILRLLSPSYRRMARGIVALLDAGAITYLAIGVHAARDMARLCGLMHGDWRCLFRAPKLEFQSSPCGMVSLGNNKQSTLNGRKYCLDKIWMWGYYVAPSKSAQPVIKQSQTTINEVKVLWVGRFLDWKCVDDIVRAVGECARLRHDDASLPMVSLDIYGTGHEENRLRCLAAKCGGVVRFFLPVPIGDVRRLMREHDVYVLASNGYEGWGAVVSEALEEGMHVIGTYEAGSSATLLPNERLFHSGDWRGLARILGDVAKGRLARSGIGPWTAENAANALLNLC